MYETSRSYCYHLHFSISFRASFRHSHILWNMQVSTLSWDCQVAIAAPPFCMSNSFKNDKILPNSQHSIINRVIYIGIHYWVFGLVRRFVTLRILAFDYITFDQAFAMINKFYHLTWFKQLHRYTFIEYIPLSQCFTHFGRIHVAQREMNEAFYFPYIFTVEIVFDI